MQGFGAFLPPEHNMHHTTQHDPIATHTDNDPGRNSKESTTSDIIDLRVVGVEEVNEEQRNPEVSDSWSSEEQNRLSSMRVEGMTWREVAKVRAQTDSRCPLLIGLHDKHFPNRTKSSIKRHWYKVSGCICF